MSDVIWIQTVWNSDGIPGINFQKGLNWKKSAVNKKHAKELNLCILEICKQVIWLTMKTQMKYHIMQHFASVSIVC